MQVEVVCGTLQNIYGRIGVTSSSWRREVGKLSLHLYAWCPPIFQEISGQAKVVSTTVEEKR